MAITSRFHCTSSNTYVDQWNLAIQKQIGSSWLFKASYLGNDVIHLWVDQEGNPSIYLRTACSE